MASPIHLVTSDDSTEFAQLEHALTHSSLIGLDAEWKPNRQAATFPTVSLLQIACRVTDSDDLPVFLVDLQAIRLPSVYELLREVFVSADVVKLGFRFKQDLVYLSSTFRQQGLEPGFETVEPYIDINAIYSYLQPKQLARRTASKQNKSLATICSEVLGITLSKEYQCSDWSQRPLTEEQKQYAASDALCLVEIFKVFQQRIVREGYSSRNRNKQWASAIDLGLKQIFDTSNTCNLITRTKFCDAAKMISIAVPELLNSIDVAEEVDSLRQHRTTKQADNSLLWIIMKHGDKILLKDSDRTPKASRKKSRKSTIGLQSKPMALGTIEDWDGTPPWDPSVGGDGCARFLCDVMVEGLAKHLRCVGIDAAIPHTKKPGTRELIDQAQKEKRVLLTRDAKLLRHEYLIKNQIYRVKSLLKNEQLVEVIETFQLKISEGQLMSRCTKCNGRFIQKPLSTEEAVEAAKGFQVIPNCLFNKNIEFWQCMDCNQLYWEGTQYHNAVQKFIDVCKLNE